MKQAATLAIALGGVLLGVSSCADPPEVKIVLQDACEADGLSFREAGDYVEFAVFRNGCPSDADLAAGKTSKAVSRKVVAADANLPSIGGLDQVKYGFAALVRNQGCGVVGFGCTAANMENVREVRIAVCDWSAEAANGAPTCGCKLLNGPGCESPTVCSKGRCEQTGECVLEDEEPGCDLTVVSSGALPPAGTGTTVAGGPGIVATPDGFVVGYREQNSTGAEGSVKLVGMTDCGQPAVRASVDLGANNLTCAGGSVSDGVGMGFASGAGLAAASLPNCGSGGGVLLMPFNAKGELHGPASGPRNNSFQKFTIASPTGAVAPSASPTDFELVYRIDNASSNELQRVVLSAPPGDEGPSFKQVQVAFPLGPDPVPFGLVATSASVRAFVGPVPTVGVRLAMGPNGSDLIDSKGFVDLPDANWAAATAWNDKAAAMVPTATGGAWAAAQLSGSTVSEAGTGTVGSGSLQGGALATLGDNLLMLTSTTQGMTVHRFTGAEGTLATSASSSVPLELSGGVLSGFDGKQVAMTAARSRVAVVWLNSAQVSADAPLGGWALLKCAE